MTNKIAFCFLIYDEIDNEELWNNFFSNADKNKFNIYIHYKINKPLLFLDEYKLPECVDTKYGDVSLILAQNKMFQYAFEHDLENNKFILLSGSCIPLKSFNDIYNKLTNTTKGFFNISPHDQCFPNCDSLLDDIPREYVGKSSQWCILNRLLVEKLAYKDTTIIKKLFQKIYAPDEVYYYTFIKFEHLENEIETTPNIAEGATTFTNWEGMSYKYVSKIGIQNYREISIDEILFLLNSPCLFGRKFLKECKISNSNISLMYFLYHYFQFS
jgi:hypothetical protein